MAEAVPDFSNLFPDELVALLKAKQVGTENQGILLFLNEEQECGGTYENIVSIQRDYGITDIKTRLRHFRTALRKIMEGQELTPPYEEALGNCSIVLKAIASKYWKFGVKTQLEVRALESADQTASHFEEYQAATTEMEVFLQRSMDLMDVSDMVLTYCGKKRHFCQYRACQRILTRKLWLLIPK